MTGCAARVVDGILPHVPVRQWVLSLPHRLRYLLAWDHELCRAVLAVYARAVLSFQRRIPRDRPSHEFFTIPSADSTRGTCTTGA
jgi:hypothetical protein